MQYHLYQAAWGRFFAHVATAIPPTRLDDETVVGIAARFVCDYLSALQKIDRGELLAAQRWLHHYLAEANFNLLHELKERRGEKSYHVARRIEQVIDDRWRRAVTVAQILLKSHIYWSLETRRFDIASLVDRIENARTDVPTASYNSLQSYYGQSAAADKLLAEYWARRAGIASSEGRRDEAAILSLKSLSIADLPDAKWQARRAIFIQLPFVRATFQHTGRVYHAAFSADGCRVVTASADKSAQIWDAETGLPIGNPLKHKQDVYHAEFSADGRRVVTASFDNTARIWDAQTGLLLGSPLIHERRVSHAEFSPDGRWIVTASDGATARVWELPVSEAEAGLPELPPGTPDELLKTYVRRFALEFVDEQKSPLLRPVIKR